MQGQNDAAAEKRQKDVKERANIATEILKTESMYVRNIYDKCHGLVIWVK